MVGQRVMSIRVRVVEKMPENALKFLHTLSNMEKITLKVPNKKS